MLLHQLHQGRPSGDGPVRWCCVIGDEVMLAVMGNMLHSSQPGAVMHYLHVLSAPPAAVGPLGLPVPGEVVGALYALAPTGPDVPGENFVMAGVRLASQQAAEKGHAVLFAALQMETFSVPMERFDAQARELRGRGRLSEHPAAAELTTVYGACEDGRRWSGLRWLTGPSASDSAELEVLVGAPHPGEGFSPAAVLVRRLVGQGW